MEVLVTNFNTSHVNVNQTWNLPFKNTQMNFNTSHVNVNQVCVGNIPVGIKFQYISC